MYPDNSIILSFIVNGDLEFGSVHKCAVCNTDSFISFSKLIAHLEKEHNIKVSEYQDVFNIKIFSSIKDSIGIELVNSIAENSKIEIVLEVFEQEKNVKTVNDEKLLEGKKKYVRINGEVSLRIVIGNVETWQRLHKKIVGGKVVSGGLTELDEKYIPEINENFYLSEKEHVAIIKVMSQKGFRSLLLSGDTGIGKTESALQIAGRMRQPVIRLKLTGNTKVSDIFQSENWDEKKKKIVYQDKAILKAMRRGYTLLVDEISAASPTVNFIFFELLEKGTVSTIDEKRVPAHPMFKIIFTDNRIGNSNYFRYHGTFEQNLAFLNRINTTVHFKNLSEGIEKGILKNKYPGIQDNNFLTNLIKVTKILRGENEKGTFSENFPTRTLESICDNYLIFEDSMLALEYGYINKLNDTSDIDFVRAIFQRVFGGESETRTL